MGESTNACATLRFDRRIRLEFHGATITSDAGLLACRELDDALGLTETADECLQESRGGRNVQHRLVGLLRQSVYSRLAGGYQRPSDTGRDCSTRQGSFTSTDRTRGCSCRSPQTTMRTLQFPAKATRLAHSRRLKP